MSAGLVGLAPCGARVALAPLILGLKGEIKKGGKYPSVYFQARKKQPDCLLSVWGGFVV